jgi:hypothetical protein
MLYPEVPIRAIALSPATDDAVCRRRSSERLCRPHYYYQFDAGSQDEIELLVENSALEPATAFGHVLCICMPHERPNS